MKATSPMVTSNSGPIFCDLLILITWVMVLASTTVSFGLGLFPAVFTAMAITLGSLGVKYLAQIRNATAIRYNHEVLRMPLERKTSEESPQAGPRERQSIDRPDRGKYEHDLSRRTNRWGHDF